MIALFVLAQQKINVKPDPQGLPGSDVGEQMVSGLFWYALLGCVAAMLVGAAVWAFASKGHNPHYAQMGKGMALVAFVGALVAGAAPALIDSAANLGGEVK